MKYFFWFGMSAYVFLYFFAAWVYDDFSMPVAIGLFILLTGFVYWRYQRHIAHQKELVAQNREPVTQSVDRPTLSIWRSPIPYLAVIALSVIIVGFRI